MQRTGRIRRGQDGVSGVDRGTSSGVRSRRLPSLPRPVGLVESSTVSESSIVRFFMQLPVVAGACALPEPSIVLSSITIPTAVLGSTVR